MRKAFLALQVMFAAAVVWFAGARMARYWDDIAAQPLAIHVAWGAIALSAIVVLASYATLIETWRRVLGAWGGALTWPATAHIWFVSSLGRYVPGKVWQIGAMGALAQRAGVSPFAATGSSVVVNLVNLLAGGAVVLAAGADVLHLPGAAAIAAVVLTVVLLTLPYTVPGAVRLAAKVSGRTLAAPVIPFTSLVVAFAGCTIGWLLYGLGFNLLERGLLGGAAPTGGIMASITVYTASYLAGYIAFFAPGGIVVRESMMVETMTSLGLADLPHATLIAVVSRLWITVLELTPGLIFLARRPPRAATTRTDPDVPT
jgi:hypothetical protein